MMVFPDPERRDKVKALSGCLPPIVILARTQMAENIGATARAMMNCGLSDLRLVAPRDGWPIPSPFRWLLVVHRSSKMQHFMMTLPLLPMMSL